MDQPNSFREILNNLSPDCEILYVLPAFSEQRKTSDYLYLLHKEMILGKEKPKVVGIPEWQYHHLTWSAMINKESVVHCNWIEARDYRSLARILYLWLCLIFYKRKGGKIVWTIHNKVPQGRSVRWLNRKLQKWLTGKADVLRVHCKTAAAEMADYLHIDESRFTILPHPRFPAYLLPRTAAIEAINQRFGFSLQSRNQIYLMFGNIGSHKQIIETIDIFQELSVNKKLLIVGPVKQGHLKYYHKIKKLLKKTRPDIYILPKVIKADIVPEFFNAADFCVFNYGDILTSGGVELARSYQKAIIAPAKGCLKEMEDNENVNLFRTGEEFKKLLTDS